MMNKEWVVEKGKGQCRRKRNGEGKAEEND